MFCQRPLLFKQKYVNFIEWFQEMYSVYWLYKSSN